MGRFSCLINKTNGGFFQRSPPIFYVIFTDAQPFALQTERMFGIIQMRGVDDQMTDKIIVNGTQITITTIEDKDYISLTDMLKAKDGDFFISDWLSNRNTVEFLGIWEQIHNPDFNYGEFAIIKSQAGLNSYKISVKEEGWNERRNQTWRTHPKKIKSSYIKRMMAG